MRRIVLEDDGAGEAFTGLEPGDLVFFDGSHRALQNSDVVVFFNELLPGIPEHCVYGVHDIWLPFDYPVAWHDRFYSEQYMLSLVAGGRSGTSHPASRLARLHQRAVR